MFSYSRFSSYARILFGYLFRFFFFFVLISNFSWFHGFLSSEESAKFLELQPPGTFLLRFSKSKAGSFALAYVDKEKNIGHSLIQYTPSGFSIHENSQQTDRNRVFDKLDRLVEHYSFILKTPLDTTLSRQPWFHGDLDKDEAFELLRQKTDGSFLIRFSSKRGYLTITFVAGGQCNHTMIEPGENGQGWICDGKSYPSIEQFLDENKATFKTPVENLIMGGPVAKKSHGVRSAVLALSLRILLICSVSQIFSKSSKSKSKNKLQEEKLIAGSNYAQLPAAGASLRSSSPAPRGDDGGSNYGSIPATASEPSVPAAEKPAPSTPTGTPASAVPAGIVTRADSGALARSPSMINQQSMQRSESQYAVLGGGSAPGSAPGTPVRSGSTSTLAPPGDNNNYGQFPGFTGGAAASPGPTSGSPSVRRLSTNSSMAAPAPGNSNYGQFPDAATKPASNPSLKTSGNLGVVTGGGAVAAAPSGNYGVFPDAKTPSQPSLGVTTGGGAAAAVAPASSNYGQFPDAKPASAPVLGVTTGGGAAAAAPAANNSNYGVFPDAKAGSAPALGVTTGGSAGGLQRAPSTSVAPAANSNYGVFPDAKTPSKATGGASLGVVTGGGAAPAPAAAAPAGSANYGVIPTAGSSYAAQSGGAAVGVGTNRVTPTQNQTNSYMTAMANNPTNNTSAGNMTNSNSSPQLRVAVSTNRLMTVKRDEDDGDAFPMLPPQAAQAPAEEAFGAFPAATPPPAYTPRGDDEFSPFPVAAANTNFGAPVGNENKRRRRKKTLLINPDSQVFGYDVPDLEMAPLFLLPEPDPNAPPMYEPEWSPELLSEALFDTMARGGIYLPPEKLAAAQQSQQQVGAHQSWHPTAYLNTDDGLAPTHSQLLMQTHFPSVSDSGEHAFPALPGADPGPPPFAPDTGDDAPKPIVLTTNRLLQPLQDQQPQQPQAAPASANYGTIPMGPAPTATGTGSAPVVTTGHAPANSNYGSFDLPPPQGNQVSTNRSTGSPAPAAAAAPENSNYGSFPTGPSSGTQVSTNRSGAPAAAQTQSQQQAPGNSNYGAFPIGPSSGSQVSTNRGGSPAAAAPAQSQAAPAGNSNYGAFPIGNAPTAVGTTAARTSYEPKHCNQTALTNLALILG